MELVILNDLAKEIPSEISFNYEEIASYLASKLDYYNNLMVTEESITGAKKDQASLRRLIRVLEDQRKEVKQECLRPYYRFEEKIKQLVSMVADPVFKIDEQINHFEEKKRCEKYASLEELYKEAIGDLLPLVPFEKILDPKWVNKSATFEMLTQDIDRKTKQIRADIETLNTLNVQFKTQVIDTYLRNFNMSEALNEISRLEEQKKALEVINPSVPTVQKPAETKVKTYPSAEHQTSNAFDFRAFLDEEQRQQLKTFCKENAIKITYVPVDSEGRIIPWQKTV